jgi:hypothetical protein
MPDDGVLHIDITAEVAHYFDDSSLSAVGQPRVVVVMGGVAMGKTTLRKQKFPNGFVLVDAADIFVRLSQGKYFPFPGPIEDALNLVGGMVASRAISEKRHIVTEVVGAEYADTEKLLTAMRGAGYRIELVMASCEMEEAMRRNVNRGPDEISAYYAEPFQRGWLIDAAGAGSHD